MANKLRKGERITGRRGFKVDEMPEDAREKVLELMHHGIAYEKISEVVNEVYGEQVSPAALCRYNRMLKEQIEMATEKTRYIRELSKAAMEKIGDDPDVDIGKFLTMRVEGEILTYLNTIDVQEELKGLRFDQVASIMKKLGDVTVRREALIWKTKLDRAFKKLDAQAKEAQGSGSGEGEGEVNEALESQLATLLEHYGPEQIRAGLSALGVIAVSAGNKQGLDPDTLKTIREEIYGIFK